MLDSLNNMVTMPDKQKGLLNMMVHVCFYHILDSLVKKKGGNYKLLIQKMKIL